MMSGGTAGSEETKADTSEKTRMTTDSQGMGAQQGRLGQEVPRELGHEIFQDTMVVLIERF